VHALDRDGHVLPGVAHQPVDLDVGALGEPVDQLLADHRQWTTDRDLRPQLTQRLAELLQKEGDLSGARDALRLARAHPECAADWAPEVEGRLSTLTV
jgi:hypothetical protein